MNVAFVTDCLSDFSHEQIQKLMDSHTICVFLPESYDGHITGSLTIRRYTEAFRVAALQRYDVVLFCVQDRWETILPVMREVMGVAIIAKSSPYYDKISKITKYLVSSDSDLDTYVSDLPKHIHWKARNEREILGRVEAFGLLTPGFQQKYEQIFGKISKEERKATNEG